MRELPEIVRFSDVRPEPYPDRSEALPAERLTWTVLTEIEPALADLENELRAIEPVDDPRFCANRVWYGYADPLNSPRRRMMDLAGFRARSPLLRSRAAYDLAYQYLYALLPDCRDCLCGRFGGAA